MTVFPNAKLNLGLNVLRKRPDGYHDLDTLFIPYFGFKDRLDIVPSAEFGIDIFREGGVDWDPMQDLCAKAWRLLRDDFGIDPVHISLEKNIPVGAGLGGGSADAAFTLAALNDIFSLGLSRDALAAYASGLGSDCAFFVWNRPMLGSGRGEVLEDFDLDLSPWRVEVTVPSGVSVSTAEAYRGIVPCVREIPLREVLSMPVEEWRGRLVNDFEKTVFAAHPVLAGIKEDFYSRGAVYASMSGSGSSVYGIFRA